MKFKYLPKGIPKFPLMMKATSLIAEALRLVGPDNVRGIIKEYLYLKRGEERAEARSRKVRGS
jgi:hypothetical protein